MKRCLILALGFTGADFAALNRALAQKGWADRVKVIGRNFAEPLKLAEVKFRDADYQFLIDATYRSLFAEKGRSIFCAHDSKTCYLKFGKSKSACINKDPSSCRDERPELILFFYMSPEGYKVGGRLGRFAMPIQCPAELFKKRQRLAAFVVDQIATIEPSSIWSEVRRKDLRQRMLLPASNFKNRQRTILLNAIDGYDSFRAALQTLMTLVIKKGAKYVDDRDMEFKVDMPHRFPSPEAGQLPWLNAHYRHGISFDERHHYDVTSQDDAAVSGVEFFDLLSGQHRPFSASHLNIFPNDEVQI